jgi:hypothetical protein
MNTTSQVRCPACGEWNAWSQESDCCSSCSAVLKPVSEAELANTEQRKQPLDLNIPIHPDEPVLMRMAKHTFNAVQLVFMAIVSFFVWLFIISPG